MRWPVVLASAMLAGPASAGPSGEFGSPDPPAMIDADAPPLRWDNIEGSPFWVDGEVPHHSLRLGMHVLDLEPGRTARILLPANTVLRIVGPDGPLPAHDIEAWCSDGSGLQARVEFLPSPDGRSLFFAPGTGRPSLVTLGRPASATGTRAVAVFFSRVQFSDREAALWRMPGGTGERTVISGTDLESRLFSSRAAWRAVQEGRGASHVRVEGPGRLLLVTRLAYPAWTSTLARSCQLRVNIDETSRLFRFETTVDTTGAYRVGRGRSLLGTPCNAHLEIPSGSHLLSIEAAPDLYWRIYLGSVSDYLMDDTPVRFEPPLIFRGLEGDPRSLLEGVPGSLVLPRVELSPRHLLPPSILEALVVEGEPCMDGGLLTAMLARHLGAQLFTHPADREALANIERRNSYYRSLDADGGGGGETQVVGAFPVRRLLDPMEEPSDVHLAAWHLPASMESRSSAVFTRAPEDRDSAAVYRMPERRSPTTLRVLVAHPCFFDGDIQVQLGNAGPVSLRVRSGPELPAYAFVPSRIEAALAGRAALLGLDPGADPHAPTALLSGLPIFDVGSVEIPIDEGIREVRLWRVGQGIPPLVALQVLADKPFELGEEEYLQALDRSRGPFRGILDEFVAWLSGAAASGVDDDLRRLRLGWFRLMSYVRTRLEAGIVPAEGAGDAEPSVAQQAEPVSVEAARKLEQEGEWLLALEAWNDVIRSDVPAMRSQGLLGRARALSELGERFLAETQLLGLWMHSGDPELQRVALSRYLQMERQPGPDELDIGVLWLAAARTRDPAIVRRLAEALVASGDDRVAIDLILGLPEEEQPLQPLVEASWNLGWWKSFDRAVGRLGDEAARAYWTGLRRLRESRTAESLDALHRGGPRGREAALRLSRSLAIEDSLLRGDLAARCEAILLWESLLAEESGPWRWTDDPSLVTEHAGVDSCRSAVRQLQERYYRADSDRPVRARVLGPVTLRLEARPLHAKGTSVPLDAWLTVRDRGAVYPVAVLANLPASGVDLVGGTLEAVGTKIIRELRFGPGLHDIEISPEGHDVLVRILVGTPWRPCTVLPPLRPRALRELLDPGTQVHTGPRGRFASRLRLIRDAEMQDVLVSPIHPVGDDPFSRSVRLPEGIDPLLAARLALRIGDSSLLSENLPGLRSIADGASAVSAEERWLAGSWRAELENAKAEDSPWSSSLPGEMQGAILVGRGELEALVDLPADHGAIDPLRRLELLLYAAEHDASLARRARILGESLFRANAHRDGLQGPFRRLMKGTVWERIATVRDSAGFRSVSLDGWKPENPDLRVRKALIETRDPEERLLVGRDGLGVFLRSGTVSLLRIRLRLAAVEFLPRAEVAVSYRVDEGDPVSLRLSPFAPEALLEIPVPAGEHVVRLGMERPAANQFVRVQLEELRDGTLLSDTGAGDSVGFEAKREYAVSTREHPLRILLEGPAWLRVDEFRDGVTRIRMMELAEGWHDVVLPPEDGRDEALLRVFRRVEAPLEPPAVAVRPTVEKPVILPPPLRLSFSPVEGPLAVVDHLELGGQEDGTLSLGAIAWRRRVFDEDDADDRQDFDDLVQLMGIHRGWDVRRRIHFQTSLLARVHGDAGPSAGFEEEIRTVTGWLPFSLKLRGSAYVQWPDAPMALPEGSVEWCGTLSGSISRRWRLGQHSYHVPSVGAFGRILSLHSAAEYPGVKLDPDVFTQYKDDHRNGIVLSETVVCQPWLDTEFWGRVSLTSNEDLGSPLLDHISGWVGCKQYFKGIQLDVSYMLADFLDDEDRSGSRYRQAVAVDVLYDLWVDSRNRLELGVEYRHDFPTNVGSGLVFLSWHFSNGRGYLDFWPGDVDFLPLRTSRVPDAHGNALGGQDRG